MGVSIWEGSKAQELIDAITQTEKLNAQQGKGNAGKVLAVGQDGIIVPAYYVLPDEAKVALIDCFEHVMWKTADGEKYGDALKEALYSKSMDGRIIYEIPAGSDMADYIVDTGVPVQDSNKNEDFTYLIKGTWSNGESDSFLLDGSGIYNGNINTAVRLQATYKNDNTVAFRATYKTSGGNTQTYSASSDHDVVYIVRNFSGHLIIKIYVDGTLDYSFDDYVINTNTNTTGNYRVGKVYSGGQSAWPGSIDMFRIYNVALSNQEIKELVGVEIPV